MGDIEQQGQQAAAASDDQDSQAVAQAEEQAKSKQVNRLGTASVGKLLVEYAIPSIISMVANGLYSIISSIFMGWGIGNVGQATATISLPIMIMSMSVSALIGAGGNALVALRLGEGKHKEAEHILSQAFIMVIAAGVIVTALINIFMDQVLSISGATPDTWGAAHIYIRILSIGFVLQFFGMGFNNFMRTAGAPGRALYTMVAGTGMCIVLNFLFVIVLHFGIAGSASATILGQGFSAILVFYYFVFSKKAPFKLHFHHMIPHMRIIGSIAALGSATFVLQIANSIINLVLNNQLAIYGALNVVIGATGAQASVGIAAKVIMFSFFPMMGVAIAAQPIFGYNYGAQLFARVKVAYKYALIWMVAIGVFFWIIIHLFATPIALLFGIRTESLLEYTSFVMKVQCFMMPVLGLQVLTANFFTAIGEPIKSMFTSLTRQVLYLIPLILFLPWLQQATHIIPWITSLDAVSFSYPISDALSVVTAGAMILFEFHKLNGKIKAAREKYHQQLATKSKGDSPAALDTPADEGTEQTA
jgi:putative MATE family efflux protein